MEPSPQGLTIRMYRDADEGQVVALWHASDLLRPWNDPGADIALCLRTPASALFVGELGHGAGAELCGTIMTGSDGHRGWVYYLATAPARRREGIGQKLMAHAEDWLSSTVGVGKVQLMIRAENEAVAQFYEALGYEREARIIMSKRLGPAIPGVRSGEGRGSPAENPIGPEPKER